MECIIASDVERDELVAELYHDGEQWAELSYDQEREQFRITLFPPTSGGSFSFDLAETEAAIEHAKSRLRPVARLPQTL